MKPIKTHYAGYRFRSRLEARWAVLLDAIGAEWRYEPEGYHLDEETWYLPDFWIKFVDDQPFPEGTPPIAGMWVEIKPSQPSEQELAKLRLLTQQSGHVGFMLIDTPGRHGMMKYKAGAFVDAEERDATFLPYLIHHCTHHDVCPHAGSMQRLMIHGINAAKSANFDSRRPERIRRAA